MGKLVSILFFIESSPLVIFRCETSINKNTQNEREIMAERGKNLIQKIFMDHK